MTIPFVDLSFQVSAVKESVFARWNDLLDSCTFVGGQIGVELEHRLTELFGLPLAVGVGNGCDALEIALHSCGVSAGHEVIVPSHTFVATAQAVMNVGATPVLVDIEAGGSNLCIDRTLDAISENTRAIIPVHLYGHYFNTELLIEALAERGDLSRISVIEDAAQAHGPNFRSFKRSFDRARIVCTSFYPGKNLGAFGDAGAILSDSEVFIEEARRHSNYGSRVKYVHEVEGRNSRLDPIQAAVLLSKIEHFSTWQALRVSQASRYIQELNSSEKLLMPIPTSRDAWHLFVVRSDVRDAFLQALRLAGIDHGLHYPYALSQVHPIAKSSIRHSDYNAVKQASTCFSLPLFPGLSPGDQSQVIEVLNSV